MKFTHRIISPLVAVAVAAMSVSTAQALPIYDTFGPFPEATWGGIGIPNDAVAVSSQFIDGDVLITVAMNATQRYSNPALGNNGAGTYFATPGANTGGNNESAIMGALWNFNYFIKVEGFNGATPILADYDITLYYDFDPAMDNGPGTLGEINATNVILASPDPAATLAEGSENLNFAYLAASIPGLITAPGGVFDPNALGEYNFGISVSRAGWGVETVAMDVQVIPEPATMALLALGGIVALSRRRR